MESMFGPHIGEQADFVEYHVYPANTPSIEEQKLIDIRKKYNEFVEEFTSNYIWQKQPFLLRAQTKDSYPHLRGKTTFGDNIEDEWFIVFLLMELSKKFPEDIITVEDNDGQFLLIEAANELPRWLNPETSTNRIFIKGGKLHIIPMPSTPAQLMMIPSTLNVENAISLIRSGKIDTEASEAVQQSIQSKIQQYSKGTSHTLHYAKCYLPTDVAFLLKKNPNFLGPAVNAFYYRDVDSMKYCAKMQKFSPKERVMTMVQFSKCLYAQTSQQPFNPPSIFGTLPPPSSPDHKAYSLGIKLACGFEIMYQESKKIMDKSKKRVVEDGMDEDVVAEEIDKILAEKHSVEDFPEKDLRADDDEGWMSIAPEELDALLKKRTENNKEKKSKLEVEDLDTLAKTMKDFLKEKSDFEGIDHGSKDDDKVEFDVNKFFNILGVDKHKDNDDEEESDDFDDESEEELDEDELNEMNAMMQMMDSELRMNPNVKSKATDEDIDDMDQNLIKNLLESYTLQFGASGPVSNILGALRDTKK